MAKKNKSKGGLTAGQKATANQVSQIGMNMGMSLVPHIPVPAPIHAPVVAKPIVPKPTVRIPARPQDVANRVTQVGMQVATGMMPHLNIPAPVSHAPGSLVAASLPLRYNPDRSTMIRADTPAPIAQQQRYYQGYRANNDYLGMRQANDAANAYRQKHGMNPYLSTVGDLQYKKTIDRSAKHGTGNRLRDFQADNRAKFDQYSVDSGKKMAKSKFWHTVEGIYQGLSPVDLKPQLAATYGQDVADQITQNKMNMVGNIVGTMGQFAIPYGALEGVVAKSGKVAKAGDLIGNVLKKAPMISEKTAASLGQKVAQSVTKDIISGVPLNANIALNKEHLTGADAAKNIALNSGLDVVTGGLMEAAPYAFRALKNRKVHVPEAITAQPVPAVSPQPMQRMDIPMKISGTTQTQNLFESSPLLKKLKEQNAGETSARKRTSYISPDTVSKGAEKIYKKFLDAHDDGIVEFAQAAKEDKIPKKATYAFGRVRDKDVNAIKNITGVDTSGFGISADKDSFVHIERRHGENGTQDRSMSNLDDLARIPYIIKTSDSVEPLLNKKGNIVRSKKYKNSDGTLAIAVSFKKKVDGHFFVVSAVPDTEKHQIHLMSAYILKAKKEAPHVPNMPFDQRPTSELPLRKDASLLKGTDRVLNMPFDPQVTSKLPPTDVTPSANTIPHSDGKVNTGSNELLTTPIMKALEEHNNAIGAQNASKLETMRANIERYGAIKPGMKPRRRTKIAKATKYGETMLHARTLAESKAVDKKLLNSIKKGIIDGDFGKTKVGNHVLVDNANRQIKKDGVDQALGAFKAAFDDGKTGAEHAALGYRLLQELQKTGDIKAATDVASRLADMMSANGRNLQAASIIKRLSPEGRLISITRTADKMSEEFSKKINGKKLTVPEDILKELADAKTENDIIKARHKASVALWDQIPATLEDKINAWRYIAMLANPKTHIRNVDGNISFMPLRQMKDAIGTALEKTIPVEQRTKAILNPRNKLDVTLIKYAKNDFENVKDILKTGGKYSDFTVRDLDAKIFNTKLLEKLRKTNGDLLDKEDTIFMKQAYTSSLAQWIKARKLSPAQLTEDALQSGRKYAMNEALKATYRDANSFAEAMSRIERNLRNSDQLYKKVGGYSISAAFPFKKTPLNIVKRGVAYSPFGILNAAVKYGKKLKGGKMDVTEVIDSLSAGLSGTAIAGVGAWLGRMGFATASADHPYSTRAGKFDDMIGKQEYSLNFGGNSYTMDWASPAALPFFTGVEAYQIARDKGISFGNLMDSLSDLLDPMMNLSMLQGVNSLIKTGYDDNAIATLAGKTAENFAGQFVPTVLGQVARTIDDTRRSTVSTAESTSTRGLEKFGNQQLAKIPGVSKTLEPYIDLWGREQKTGSLGERALTNFLSPGYYAEDKSTAVDKEIRKLADKVDPEIANAIYPPATGQYDVKIDGQKYRMSPKELTAFKKTRGQTAYKDLSILFKSSEYKKMDTEDQTKAVKKVYTDARKAAVEGLAVSKGISPIRLLSKSKQQAYESVKGSVSEKEFLDAYKATGSGKSSVEKATSLLEHGTKKKALYNALGVNDSTLVKAIALKNTGVPMEDYKKASTAIKKWTKLSPKVKEANGGKLPVNTSSSAKKLIIDKTFPDYSAKQKIAMYNAFGVSKTLW